MDEATLLEALEPTVDELVDRHLKATKEWFPHEMVPWSRGRDYEPGEQWDPDEFPVADEVRSALFVNLLTEDNLPYYFHSISTLFGGESWNVWARRWVAEEDRHAQAIRDWLLVSRAIDPVVLERARMAQMSSGEVPDPPNALQGLIYVALQELATRLSHRNTGRLIDDPWGQEIMKRIGTDENFHHLFYRDACSAALELDPSAFMVALRAQVVEFAMPGTGIVGFDEHARRIASVGIYDFEQHHDRVLEPVVNRAWRILDVEDGRLDDDAKVARDDIAAHMERLSRAASATRRRRERRAERDERQPTPVG